MSFTIAVDAFNFDWRGNLAPSGGPDAISSTTAFNITPVMPRPLASVVVFYVTRRAFTPEPTAVDFADCLVAEPQPDASASRDAVFDAMLSDVRTAGVAEGFTVFHAVVNPAVPTSPEPLLARLIHLSAKRVLTALVVDSTVWPGTGADVEADPLLQVFRSPNWTGPVLLANENPRAINVERLVATLDLPPRLLALPKESEKRVIALRRAFIDSRGLLLRMKTDLPTDAERVPLLKGASAEQV